MCVSVCKYTCVRAGTRGSQKRAPDLLKLELQVTVSCMAWVQGTEHQSSMRAVHGLNHRAISPALGFIFNYCSHVQKSFIIVKFSMNHTLSYVTPCGGVIDPFF